ncbi:MAG TPA: protein phosphatase 2C domain-containing protein [Gemmataceae bacterium]|nr:protein phosphatase 2C domain-containing protein [Gemmataceae bacterium]
MKTTVKLFLRPGWKPVIGFDPIQHGSISDVGLRRSHNQDAQDMILAKSVETWREQGHIFIVADGMGGHAVGEKASAKAVREIPLNFLKHASTGVANALRRAFVETNASIHAIGQKNPEFKGLGTTATTLVLRPEGAWFAHVGDSRGYRIRKGEIQQLTFDHSLLWEMARRQNVEPEELHGLKSNIIIRSLGPDALVQVDIEGPHPVQPGDVFVICSDGLSGPVQDTEIGAVASMLPPEEACRFLVQLANLRGGPDNITVQIVRIGGAEGTEPAAKGGAFSSPLFGIHWSLPILAVGFILTILAVMLAMDIQWVGKLFFALAGLTIVTGMVGLILHYLAEKQRRENEPPPPNINIYRRATCAVDKPVVEKLAQSAEHLKERVKESVPSGIPDDYVKHYAQGQDWLRKNNLTEAFREFCRAMYVLAVAHNSQHHKSEMFQPLFGKFVAEE